MLSLQRARVTDRGVPLSVREWLWTTPGNGGHLRFEHPFFLSLLRLGSLRLLGISTDTLYELSRGTCELSPPKKKHT